MSTDPTQLIADLDALGAPSARTQCRTCLVLDDLGPEAKGAFVRAIERGVTHEALSETLSHATGTPVGAFSIGRHIRKGHDA